MVSGIPVDRCGAGVEPGFWRTWAELYGETENTGAFDAAFEDEFFVLWCVATVDALAAEVDDGVGSVDAGGPRAECSAVPTVDGDVVTSVGSVGIASQSFDGVSFLL